MANKSRRNAPKSRRPNESGDQSIPSDVEVPTPAVQSAPKPTRWRPTLWTWLAIVVTVAGAVIRFWDLGAKSLWFDEALSIADSRSLQSGFGSGFHPPIFYYILHAWLPFSESSDSLVRMVAAVPGALTVLAVYFAGWRFFNERAGVLAAAVLAVASLHVEYSQEVRMYALAALFTTLATIALAELMRRWPTALNGTKWTLSVSYTGLAYFAIATHYLSVLPIAGQALALLFCWRETRDVVIRLTVLQIPAILGAAVAIFGLGYGRRLGVAADFLVKMGGVNQTIFSEPGARLIALPKDFLLQVLPGPSLKWLVIAWYRVPAVLGFDLVAIGGAIALWRSTIGIRPVRLVVLMGALLPLPITTLMVGPDQLRFYLSCAPMLALLIGAGLDAMPRKWSTTLGLAVVLIPSILATWWYFAPGMDKQPWRRVGTLVSEQCRPGDIVLVNEPHQSIAFERYFIEKKGVEVEGYPEIGGVRITTDNFDRWFLPLVRNRERVWFVRMSATASTSDPEGLGLSWLNENMKLRTRVKELGYNGDVEVFLFDR